MEGLPLISLLLLAPIAGSALLWLVPERAAGAVATLAALGALVLGCSTVALFDGSAPGFQLVEELRWIDGLNVRYLVGVDRLSVLFLPATSLLFLGVIATGRAAGEASPRVWYGLLLALESATLGVFCALDGVLFFVFWELTLVPLYFLIGLSGLGPHRAHAATKYVMVMLAGGVPLLFAMIVLAFGHASEGALPAALAWDLRVWLAEPLPLGTQWWVFALLLIGFGVKTPLYPLHTWLPVAAFEGPAAVAAVVTGLKLGAFGLIRFAVPLAPEAARELHWLLAGFGVAGVLYGALAAAAQTNLRRMLAYASISHVGLVVLGVSSLSRAGVQGAVMQLLNFSLISGGLFLISGWIHRRIGSTDVTHLGGAARTMPLAASFFLFLALASIGLPGTSGFPAELLILLSAFETHAGAGAAALLGMVLSGTYVASLYRRAFFGPVTQAAVREAADLLSRELALVLVLAAIVLALGLHPSPVLEFLRPFADEWAARLAASG